MEFVKDQINFDLVSKKLESRNSFINIPFNSIASSEEENLAFIDDDLFLEQVKCAFVNSESFYDLKNNQALLQMLHGWNNYKNPTFCNKEPVLKRTYK